MSRNHSSIKDRQANKSPERALAARLQDEAGLNLAQIRITLDLLAEHHTQYWSEHRDPGTIIHTAVGADEPPGKPIKHCKVIPIELTALDEADFDVLEDDGSVELRMIRIYRFCHEAWRQGALLSYEDLHVLLGVNLSTIKDLVAKLRDRGWLVPTRGTVQDIGPEPSHKRKVATLLGQGRSTSQIRAATGHGEAAIGRYQHQFALVIYLLETYPRSPDGERHLLSDLSRKAYDTYAEVYEELRTNPAWRPHLERLRRRFEMDPEGLAHSVPAGKRRREDATDRLEEQTLHTAVRQTIQEDLGTTHRVAETVSGDVMNLLDDALVLPDSLRPGELIAFVDAHDPSFISGERLPDRPVIPVRLPLYTEEAKEIWRDADQAIGQRRARLAVHVATAVQEQGGVMSVSGLAEVLYLTPSTLSSELRKLAVELHIEAPTKGLLEDSGPTRTHKNWIVDLDEHGLTGEEISWLTRHAPLSRDRYIETYRRAEALMRVEGGIPEPQHLARVLSLRLHVAKQYVELLERYHGAREASQGNALTASAATAC